MGGPAAKAGGDATPYALGNLWATGVLALFEAGKAAFDLAWTLRLLPGRATDSFQRHLAGI